MLIDNSKFYRLLLRPVVVITTISPKGITNAAPFSFNTPISFSPPLYGFACNTEHDTWKNIKATKEFVVNIIENKLAEKLPILEKDFPYEVNELEKAGLEEIESKKVKAKRMKDAIAWIECKYEKHYKIGDHVFIVGHVVCTEVKDECFNEVIASKDLLGHLGGEFFFTNIEIRKYARG